MLKDITFDPFLWHNLLTLAVRREQQNRPIGSYELTVLCGIPKDECSAYLEEMGRQRGWVDIPHDEVLIPINPDGSDRISRE